MNKKSIPTINHYSAIIENVSISGEEDIDLCDKLSQELEVNVVDKYIYNFKPIGKTIIYVLTESHLAIHTWPEHKIIHVDLVTCSHMAQKQFELALLSTFDNKEAKITITKCS